MKRYLASLCIIAILICALPFGAAAEQPEFVYDEEWEVQRLTNAERRKEGLQPLSTFHNLNYAAWVRAKECLTLFEHTRPDGTSCFTALDQAGVDYYLAGENIAAGHTSPEHVNQGWMDSPGHRENILTPEYKHIGAGYYYNESSYYRKYWSQFFVGGCRTTNLKLEGEQPIFSPEGVLLNDPVLTVTCNLHGDAYLLLADADYTYLGEGTVRVRYDGKTKDFNSTVSFKDVAPSAWYADAVSFVYEEGIMKGVGSGNFAPDKTMTRAELVMVLYQLSGYEVAGDDGFTDVSPSDWFYNAVKWAAREGYVYGVAQGKFAPNKTLSRAELAAILFRYHTANTDGPIGQASLLFPDANDTPQWAKESLQWAVSEGLISGIPSGNRTYLMPNAQTTRAQMASILMRYLQL